MAGQNLNYKHWHTRHLCSSAQLVVKNLRYLRATGCSKHSKCHYGPLKFCGDTWTGFVVAQSQIDRYLKCWCCLTKNISCSHIEINLYILILIHCEFLMHKWRYIWINTRWTAYLYFQCQTSFSFSLVPLPFLHLK